MNVFCSSPRLRQARLRFPTKDPLADTENIAAASAAAPDKEMQNVQKQEPQLPRLTTSAAARDEEDDEKRKRLPRIIRQSAPGPVDTAKLRSAPVNEIKEEVECEQVIVIGLDETGKQPSEEQLTAIIQVSLKYHIVYMDMVRSKQMLFHHLI